MASCATSLVLSRASKRLISPQCTGRPRLCSRALWTANAPLHSLMQVSCDPLHPHRTPALFRVVPELSRNFSLSTPRRSTAVAQSFADPDRSDLFYHLFTPPTSLSSAHPVFALSFLLTPPPSVVSSSVIGWLPASGQGESAGLNDFVENGAFRAGCHNILLAHVEHNSRIACAPFTQTTSARCCTKRSSPPCATASTKFRRTARSKRRRVGCTSMVRPLCITRCMSYLASSSIDVLQTAATFPP